MGPGGSQEAAFDLQTSVPAGTYEVICDAIIIRSIDVTFDLIWRRGDTDMPLATWTHQFEPLPGGLFQAQPYAIDHDTQAIDYQPGDQLVFRYTGGTSTSMQAFIPNGDGALANGRIPNITLPR